MIGTNIQHNQNRPLSNDRGAFDKDNTTKHKQQKHNQIMSLNIILVQILNIIFLY